MSGVIALDDLPETAWHVHTPLMPDTEYDGGFFDGLRSSARSSAQVLVPMTLTMVPATSVVDVGCGTGTWLSVFGEHGVSELLGIDGDYVDRSSLDIGADRFLAADLAAPLPLSRRFDLALSLEVAEHLPAERAEGFVQDLTRLAPVVLFSAAVPNQGGTHHVNEQWPSYWADLFAVHGYESVDCLRPRLWDDARVAWWYAQNVLLYVSRDAGDLLSRLRGAPGWHTSRPLRLVHPVRHQEWVDYALAQSRARWGDG